VSVRIIQALLGHKRPSTTARDPHLTTKPFDVVQATINALMADLSPLWGTGLPEVADVFRCYGPADQERFGADLLPSHRRAMADLIRCRTEALGGQLLPWDHGGQEHYAYHSCRNRSGPKGHQHETEGWLAARRQELLPMPYFPVVLTLPQELRALVRRHQKDLDDIVRRAAAQARITLAAAPHDVGGLIGVLCVLHTWTRTLVYHPHAHCLVPAGGVSAGRTEWRPARPSSLAPVHALAQLFRGLLLELVRQERPDLTLPASVWTKGGVVYGKPTVQGAEQVLNSLGRYVHRIALPNRRLLSSADGQVSFRYQDSQARRWRTMALPADEFIRRFLQHVLPQGFHNVRHYGLWSPVHRPLLHQLQLCLAGHTPAPPKLATTSFTSVGNEADLIVPLRE
jgi:Putative transposase/Transposase zinc-binding domain